MPKRIIILGGGFAGAKCARTLRKLLPSSQCDIVLFNHENHMVFHPLLAEVVSAALQPKDVAAPLRQLLKDVQCRTEDVLAIELDDNLIEYEAHDGTRRKMSYDHLVIAAGAGVNLGLVPGMDDHAFSLKTVGDALALQTHIMEQMERAEVCEDIAQKRCYLSFIIVGGGFSGVEVAGEINDLVRRSCKFFSAIKPEDISVTILQSADQLLMEVTPWLRDFARKKMEEAGVSVKLHSYAARATREGVTLKDGTQVRGATIVCTIGTTTLPLVLRLNVPKERGRLVTAADMSLPDYPNAWAIGDCASIVNAVDGNRCPPVAQFAERQGVQAAQNIARRLKSESTKPFSYKMMGQLCSIGGQCAIAEIMGIKLSGFIAWFLWRGIYLLKLPSIAQMIKVGIEWQCDLIFPRTLAHLKADRTRRICKAYYAEGDFICHEGDPATDFFLIEQGEVEILRKQEGGNQEIVAVLSQGDFFGEGALIDSRPRNASVRARTEVQLVVLGRNIFTQISAALAPLKDAVASAAKRRSTNVWKNLLDARTILEAIPLASLIEPLPGAPLQTDGAVDEAIERMNKHRLDFCCVVDKQLHLTGIVTRSDLLRALEVAAFSEASAGLQITVKEIMVKDPVAICLDDSTGLAMLTMREHGLKRIPVIESCSNRTIRGYVRLEGIMDRVVKALTGRQELIASSTSLTRELDIP